MILVTGASGFIGSHLVEELLKKKEKIRVLVRGDLGNLKELKEKLKKIEIVKGDLLNKEDIENATKDVEKIYHLAAISKPMNIPKQVYYDANVKGIKNLLEACKKNKVKKFVHVSSMSVFGFSRDDKPLSEESGKLPVSDYGESKKLGEEFVLDFCKKNKIKCVIVRPPMVFGPRDSQFLKLFRLINTGVFPLLKAGKAKFEFCYVKNLVNGILLADETGKNLDDYNINDGQTYTIKEVFSEIAKQENKSLFPFSIPVFLVRVAGFLFEIFFGLFGKKAPFNSGTALWMSKDNVMDTSKIKRLGYKRKISLQESIKETLNWYKERGLVK